MIRLLGRKVHMVCGAMHPIEEGVVYHDNPEGVWVRFLDGTSQYIAKFRLLCNEVSEIEVCGSPIGVYLIAE